MGDEWSVEREARRLADEFGWNVNGPMGGLLIANAAELVRAGLSRAADICRHRAAEFSPPDDDYEAGRMDEALACQQAINDEAKR